MTERFPRSLAAPRAALVALSLLVGGLATGAQDARAQALDVSLSADHHFPVLGGEVEITLGGPPGASFTVQGSFTPAERPLGQAGTLFLDPGNLVALGSGVLDMSGSATLTLGVPPEPKLAGRFFFVQAAAMLDGAIGLSRALPFRLGLAPPAGARNPVAIAVTSDGAKAYVGHQKDGSISVLDAAGDRLVADLPAVAPAGGFAQTAMDLAIDPEDRHLFVAQAGTPFLTVFEVATDSVVARLEVPKGAQRLAFDFRPGRARVYLSNDRDDAVLVFEEGPPGSFTALPSLRLEGSDPSAIAVLADGRLLVGNRGSHEIEVLDPFAAGAPPTVARIPLDGLPLDIVVAGAKALVPTFRPTLGATVDGVNEVAVIDLATLEVEGAALADLGTDYLDLALLAPFVAVVAAGSGTVLVAEAASGRLLDRVELAPGQGPGGIANAIPQAAAFVPAAGGGAPDKLYVVNYFRETVRPVLLDGGPPFALGAEIPLARSGAPRVPLADLSPEEDGHWFFRSVAFFQGAPFDPNPTTCFTCHPGGASDGNNDSPSGRQVPALFDSADTAPFGWQAQIADDLLAVVSGAFATHGIFPGAPPPGADALILAFLENAMTTPPSPFLEADGALSAEAGAGQVLFEGVAGCAACHPAPLFIPAPPAPLTIAEGVGTGLAPVNVPSLRGLWNTAPYLHDGSAATLIEVLTRDSGGQHGATSGLDAQELAALVAYLNAI